MQCLCALVSVLQARPQSPKSAPSYGKQPDGYFQYVNVPAEKEYEFGWNRGHPNHYISRYEQSKDHRFRTRVSLMSLFLLLNFYQFCIILLGSLGRHL